MLSFLIVCLELLYSNNVEKNIVKNKEKVFDTNPDMNSVTSDYDYIHMVSFFQTEKFRFTNHIVK